MHGKDVVWEEAIAASNNISCNKEKNHWAPLPKIDATKTVYRNYRNVVKALVAIAKHEEKRGLHMKIILQTTSNAEEQYVLLTCYWKARELHWVRKGGRKYRLVGKDEEKKICEMYRGGMAMAKIARELGRPVSTIYYVLKRSGLK